MIDLIFRRRRDEIDLGDVVVEFNPENWDQR